MSTKQTSPRILIIFAHPSLQKSRVNRRLIEYVSDMNGVTFHDLYEAYPDFHIQVVEEQRLLILHDIVVFHHPIFWFSTPAILKEWQDLVLVHGWAIWTNTLQEMVPHEVLGRVYSIDALGSWVLLPIGFAVAGWATDLVGAPTVFLVGGSATIALIMIGLLHPAIRNLD